MPGLQLIPNSLQLLLKHIIPFKTLIKFTIIHLTALLNKEASTTITPTAIASICPCWCRFPITTTWEASSKVVTIIPLFKLLNMQQSAQLDSFQRTITVLGNAYMRFAFRAFAILISHLLVVFWAINKHYHVGILFNSTRFTQVTQLWHLAFFTCFYRTA